MDVCGNGAVYIPMKGTFDGVPLYIPETGCSDCSQFETRLSRIETLLEGLERINVSKTDTDNRAMTTTFIGRVN